MSKNNSAAVKLKINICPLQEDKRVKQTCSDVLDVLLTADNNGWNLKASHSRTKKKPNTSQGCQLKLFLYYMQIHPSETKQLTIGVLSVKHRPLYSMIIFNTNKNVNYKVIKTIMLVKQIVYCVFFTHLCPSVSVNTVLFIGTFAY